MRDALRTLFAVALLAVSMGGLFGLLILGRLM